MGPLLILVFINKMSWMTTVSLSLLGQTAALGKDTAAFATDKSANFAVIKLQRQLNVYIEWPDEISIRAFRSATVLFS